MYDIELNSNEIISKAVILRASDVHVIPGKEFSTVQFRVDENLLTVQKLSIQEAEKLISHFKFRSKMDIGERRRPQNGSLYVISNNQPINLRVSTLPSFPHESLSIRILPQNEVTLLSSLALFPKQIIHLRNLMKKSHGLLLISGPTGSGKSTTIYSLLHERASSGKRIISIEDPVEKRTNAFIQVEINEKAGLTYAEALKASLRHDPDIIMVGEIRDEKTAQIAVRAAMTGHLVISTIHAKCCTGSVSRLQELGVAKHDIEETVVGLVSQRLVSIKCPYCKGNCSHYCQLKRERRRLAIYEILSGNKLISSFQGNGAALYNNNLSSLLRKAVALGFINISEYERWI